ncbi:MAG: hypothetical protein DGJ47_000968 [Rickettsiaceae bacterium]
MITLQSLGLSIEGKRFFKDLSISFLPSAIIRLNGPNGCGKTSLLRMIAGIQSPTNGTIKFNQKQLSISLLDKPYCNYIGHKTAIKNELTVIENMSYWGKLCNSEILIPAAIKYFNLEDILEQKCLELSEGNKKKVALSRLIICPAKLWLLDEIDTNLDTKNKELLTNLIVSHADSGGLTIMASHNTLPIKTTLDLTL